MVPKLHAKGSSFKGAAAYLLHDKGRADSSERVEWSETRNLAVVDPDAAWRIMAATALDQARLKANAGVANTGRKSDKHVLHLTLSWHPDQAPDRDELIRAADGAINALGATDHQAMIVAHNDEDHPHVHVLINRVSPHDGRHLSSSKEKLKLSQWAQAYEEETGIFCENRIINNERRAKGEFVRGEPNIARHIFEEMRAAAANDNKGLSETRNAQKAKDHALALRGRNMAKLHASAQEKLAAAHQSRKEALARSLRAQVEKARARVIEDFRPAWTALNKRQRGERETFEALELSFFGRTSNMAKTLRLSTGDISEGRNAIISRAFRILTNAGERRAYFDRAQERARTSLETEQAGKVHRARIALIDAHKTRLNDLRAGYLAERRSMLTSQKIDQERLKADWRERSKDRAQAYEELAKRNKAAERLRNDYGGAAGPEASRRAVIMGRYERALEFRKAAQEKSAEQDNSKDRDEGNER